MQVSKRDEERSACCYQADYLSRVGAQEVWDQLAAIRLVPPPSEYGSARCGKTWTAQAECHCLGATA